MMPQRRWRRAVSKPSPLVPGDYIALWLMAGDATDVTGDYDIGLFGGADQHEDHVDYDGNNDYGQCARLAFNDNAFTLIMLVRFDGFDTDGVWIANSRSDDDVTAKNEWQLTVFSPASGGLNKPRVSICNTEGTFHSATFNEAIAVGTWYTVSVRFTGSAVQIFNGLSLQESTEFTGTMNTGSTNTRFARRGWNQESASTVIHGHLDQSRSIAYDYALSDAELAATITAITTGVGLV
ncbi:hypothetical protein Q7C_850 [Methylophaga frappieri]|uniref:Uncharacterized protein n=1 Tax=Methylophaga frappieri (strain ATCC BAA-2434 / DSM 25690 / JAM7) TaxID=754477 RepID=I1YGH6_METFJ|nr:LamG-like jellyroll fold domain-containing protein [Methylophaga frappieri]AFJ02019.1 hypothetical protein Q7C_850 [Methylophaga frappieri]